MAGCSGTAVIAAGQSKVPGYPIADRVFTIDLGFLLDWWPALLVAFGGWQVFAYFQEKKRREELSNEAAAAEALKS